jgi:hypothetical protein
MNVEVKALAEATEQVEGLLDRAGDTLASAIATAGLLSSVGVRTALNAGISPGLIGEVLDYAGRMQADLGHAALMLQGVHASLHEALERLSPTEGTVRAGGQDAAAEAVAMNEHRTAIGVEVWCSRGVGAGSWGRASRPARAQSTGSTGATAAYGGSWRLDRRTAPTDVTAAVILISFLASMALYRFTAWDGYLYIFGVGITFYVAVFVAGLFAASIFAARSRDRRCILGVIVLWLNFIGSHVAWSVGDPNLYAAGVLDVLTAAYFVLYGQTRWEWTIGGLYLVSVVLGFLSFVGVVPGADERVAAGFIAFSYPDIAAILGEIAVAVLGLGAGGQRVKASG